ncbi:stealth family protein [Acinetobacter sp. MD2]|uniref:stealth family protein n=1 Tax=Acinetobacter sp. MD2 TaxID=2600066 RepID=UPI002D1ED1CC|nr:stealth family protein [Acinetobacter sp. MD2]MEB3767530.1 Stealth CR1 domain-containing protein [Acinetobacter sp. MD2]
MRKIKKLIKNPGVFFRDFLTKKYPIVNCEQKYSEQDEVYIAQFEKLSWGLEDNIVRASEDIVDVVFTWVDNKDPEWIKKYSQYSNACLENSVISANDTARFENHDEIYYSTYSVRKYLPWVRNIYIITDSQVPKLHKICDNVIIIDHKEIIDQKYLPTFNSHVIEAHLHKINGLSEDFIYFNDDVFVAKELSKTHFFRKNGVASIFPSKKNIEVMINGGFITPTLYASLNSKEIIKKTFDVEVNTPLVHTYMSLKKSTFKEVFNENIVEIESFLSNKFRSKNDINMATYLVPWVMYLKGLSVATPEICYYFNIRSNHAISQYEKLINAKNDGLHPHSFCANDFYSEKQDLNDYQSRLNQMLEQYFFEEQ